MESKQKNHQQKLSSGYQSNLEANWNSLLNGYYHLLSMNNKSFSSIIYGYYILLSMAIVSNNEIINQIIQQSTTIVIIKQSPTVDTMIISF